MSKISVTLTAANMGNVDETDFDLWTKFVSENHEAALGFEIAEIDQHRFSGGPDRDTITGGTEDERAAMLEAFPGLLTPISMAAAALAEGKTEETGKD